MHANEHDPGRDAEFAPAEYQLTEPPALLSPYIEYALRGRNAPWRYLAGFVGAVVLAIVAAGVIILALQLTHILPLDIARSLQDAGQPATFYPATGLIFGVLLLSFVAAARVAHGKRFQDIIGAWRWSRFGQGAAIWLVVLLAATLIDFLIDPAGFRVTASAETPRLAAFALAGLAIQTFAEEFIFRGYVTQGLLAANRRTLPTALISGVLFGAMHIPNGVPQAVSAAVFGVMLALIAIETGGLAFSYGLHLANNVFGGVVVISGGDVFRGSPGILAQSSPQLMWWDTVVGAVSVTLVAAWLFWSKRRDAKSSRTTV